jgi:hypothetical protein
MHGRSPFTNKHIPDERSEIRDFHISLNLQSHGRSRALALTQWVSLLSARPAIRLVVYAISRKHTNANAGLWVDRHATAAPHKIQFNGAGGSRPYIGFMRIGA